MTGLEQGARIVRGGVEVRVWAPGAGRVAVRALEREHPMAREEGGFFRATIEGLGEGARYALAVDGGEPRGDPASRRQPEGVHGPSQVFDPGRHAWQDAGWRGLPLERLVFYELHVGTFTALGTLDAAAERLPDLVDLGVTCVELMPVQPFPGARNWGYDGVFPYAVHEGYGGPAALQRFVDRAHALGLAVCLDVVYNHLGPEGNVLPAFGPYFTHRHSSPWGDALDYDGPGSGPVRELFLGAAMQWLRDFHADALRLDATHAIFDDGPRHFVGAIRDAAFALEGRMGRAIHVVAENDENDRKVLDPPPAGWGASAVWADDLHHALHALLTGESARFLADFGRPEQVARALAEGFAYQGEPSRFRGGKAHGTPTAGLLPSRFVACLQNHDQVGNRPGGERLATLVPWEALAPAAALVLLGSALPLVFMGEEYGESRPFLYFTSHGDPALARAVSEGRRSEFIAEAASVPDPQDAETFTRSILTHRRDGRHARLREHYRRCLALRRKHEDAIARRWPEVTLRGRALTLERPGLLVRANLSPEPAAGLKGWGLEIVED